MSDKVKARFRQSEQFFNTVREDISTYDITKRYEMGYADVDVDDTISEKDFYMCFLYLKAGLSKTVYRDVGIEHYLTGVNLEYMSTIMAKDLDYSMPSKSKNKVQQALAVELNRTPQSAYNAINRLKKAGYLVVTEDDLITPNPELQRLRVVTKQHLEKIGCFPMTYMLNFVVKND
jgi:hypothetical protein